MNGYKLSREWFDWCFENPSKAKPSHTAVYFWIIELCNRLGWKEQFGVPALYSMEATGISSKNTYYKAFNNLAEWGFIEIIEKAKNQNTANIIKIVGVLKNNTASNTASNTALDTTIIQERYKQENSPGNIDKPDKPDKPINNKTKKEEIPALEFLKLNCLDRLNTECSDFNKIDKIDKSNLITKFNAQMQLEIAQGKIKLDVDQLIPRLKKFIISWHQNQNRYSQTPEPDSWESGKLPRR